MMDAREIEKLKKAVEDKYEKLFRELSENKKEELNAIDIVCRLQKDFSQTSKKEETFLPEGGIAQIVREAIKKTDDDFDLNSISEFIKTENPEINVTRGNFHAAVRKMLNDKEVILVEKGLGKRTSRYLYVGNKKQEKNENEDSQIKEEKIKDKEIGENKNEMPKRVRTTSTVKSI